MKLLLLLSALLLVGCTATEHEHINNNFVERDDFTNEIIRLDRKIEDYMPPTTKTINRKDLVAADKYLQSEQSCQDCLDWYITHQLARDEFKECERSWYFSSHMAIVCTFEMQWKAPSGKLHTLVCPGFNNKYCVGPIVVPSDDFFSK